MVRKINKRSVYYIKSFVNSVGLSDAGIALFTYLPTLSLCRVIVSQEKDKMIMLNPADLFFFCSFLAVLMSFLWILYCTLESKTTERIYCAQFLSYSFCNVLFSLQEQNLCIVFQSFVVSDYLISAMSKIRSQVVIL